MPARRTRKKQTRRGGSLRGAFDQVMQRLSKKATQVKRRLEKRKNAIASRAAAAAKRRKDRWLPMPTVVQTPYGLVNTNPYPGSSRQPTWGPKLLGKINKGKIPKIAAAY